MNTTESKYYLLGQAVRMRLMGQTEPEWESLYNGNWTTDTEWTNGRSWHGIPDTAPSDDFSAGDVIRLTVNGVSKTYTAVQGATAAVVLAGNLWLSDTDSVDSDNGDDYLLWSLYEGLYLFSREAGTYTVKVERLVS